MNKQIEINKVSKELKNYLLKQNEFSNMSEKNDLLDLTDKLKEKMNNAVNKEKILRIGIVGQVKAGKSSFINALLFDGKDVLPKASTPMTAALTVIKYSEKIYAEVEFYSKKDWEIIVRNAKEFEKVVWDIAKTEQKKLDEDRKKILKRLIANDEEIKENIISENTTISELVQNEDIFTLAKNSSGDTIFGAYELLELAKNEKIDLEKYIGRTQKIEGDILSIKDLVGKLHEYVGANGKFTPITRNTTLHLNIPTLKDIELIDTPGMNDPIISRGMTTRDFLSNCDTVFLLSTSSQFMGAEDTEFLVNTLPAEGVTNIILLGSKFDSVLVDESKKYNGDIKFALKDIYKKLSSQADSALNAVISSNPNKPIMEKIKNKEVKFISGICYNIAKKGRNNLDEMEKLALSNLEKRYKVHLDDNILFDLANIDRIRNNDLKNIKLNKNKILSNKLNDLINGQVELFLNKLNLINTNLEIKIDELGKYDYSELDKRQKEFKISLEKISLDVPQIFKDLSYDIEEIINKLIREINLISSDFTNIEEKLESKEVTAVRTIERWYWFDKKETYNKTVNYKVTSVIDAAENTKNFINKINNDISDIWDELININSIENKLIKVSLSAFDLADESFNKNSVLNPIKNALREVQIQPFQMKREQYRNKIIDSFSDYEVEGDDKINQLKEKVKEVISSIVDDLNLSLKGKLDEIKGVLIEKGENFVNSIFNHSQKEINEIKKDLENIEESKNRYTSSISQINNFKSKIEEFNNA